MSVTTILKSVDEQLAKTAPTTLSLDPCVIKEPTNLPAVLSVDLPVENHAKTEVKSTNITSTEVNSTVNITNVNVTTVHIVPVEVTLEDDLMHFDMDDSLDPCITRYHITECLRAIKHVLQGRRITFRLASRIVAHAMCYTRRLDGIKPKRKKDAMMFAMRHWLKCRAIGALGTARDALKGGVDVAQLLLETIDGDIDTVYDVAMKNIDGVCEIHGSCCITM